MVSGANSSRSMARKPKMQRPERQILTAIIVDGGFYRRRAKSLFGAKSPEARAHELMKYCSRHLRRSGAALYRIYVYDCAPSQKVLYHPLTMSQVNLAKTDEYTWMTGFLRALTHKRKVALRRGEELETQHGYQLKVKPLKALCRGDIKVSDLTVNDFTLDITQKGVDMRIGLDIASIAQRGDVNQIVMISGDSDFVPAAKHARRSGIDFILDPMWARISDNLSEHVDGIWQCVSRPPENEQDPLHVNNSADSDVETGDSDPEELEDE